LEKKGKHNTAYRSRWFVLKDDRLFYFKRHTDASAISYIPITDAVIRESPGNQSSSSNAGAGSGGGSAGGGGGGGGGAGGGGGRGRSSSNAEEGGWCFEVGTKDRVFYLRARTSSDMMMWIRCVPQFFRPRPAFAFLCR
jgi:hypothetical protein